MKKVQKILKSFGDSEVVNSYADNDDLVEQENDNKSNEFNDDSIEDIR